MQPISEEWQIQVGKNKHIISGEEMKMIIGAGEARFVRFRDLVINPAFVSDMVFLRKVNKNQLEAGNNIENKPTPEELQRIESVKQQIRLKVKNI